MTATPFDADDEASMAPDPIDEPHAPAPTEGIDFGPVGVSPEESLAADLLMEVETLLESGDATIYHGSDRKARFFAVLPGLSDVDALCPSPSVECWLAGFAWQRLGVLPKPAELSQVSRALAARAPGQMPEAARLREELASIEGNPAIHLILDYVNDRNRLRDGEELEMNTADLWAELHTLAELRGLLKVGTTRFPAGPAAFSRRLDLVKHDLARHGVGVRIRRSNGSKTILYRLPDADATNAPSSAIPSASNAMPHNELRDLRTLGRDVEAREGPGAIQDSNVPGDDSAVPHETEFDDGRTPSV